MNYYEHHLNDFAEATSHLTFLEDAAYSRCIRKYYSTEKPLPVDVREVQRLIGARTKEERASVEPVLKEFFELREDGWHNDRCDDEVARYRDKRSKAQGSAFARWNAERVQSERIANALRTHSDGNALQSPVSSLQSKEKESEDKNVLRERKREIAAFAASGIRRVPRA